MGRNEWREKRERDGSESDDQVLVARVRDAHICSKLSVLFAYPPSLPTMTGGTRRRRRRAVKGGWGCHYE